MHRVFIIRELLPSFPIPSLSPSLTKEDFSPLIYNIHFLPSNLPYQAMSFFANDEAIEFVMAINCFFPRIDLNFLPSYNDWLANNAFDPFGPKPSSPISSPNRGIPVHSRPGFGFQSEEEGVDVGNRVNHGHRHSKDTTRIVSKEVSLDPVWVD
jgi:hypothetical protein